MENQSQKVTMVSDFVDSRAPTFHPAFSTSSTLNTATMQYEIPEVRDLRETLECHHQKARKYVDFIPDLSKCSWDNVLEEMTKAQDAAAKSDKLGKRPVRRIWRTFGKAVTILEPGLSALPDELCVLHGGLAVVFSLARQSELNRTRILDAFENVPNIIESSQNKAATFKPDPAKPKNMMLHGHIHDLQETLLKALPALINILIPNTFANVWRSPFKGWKIEKILNEVASKAESVRSCSESLMDDLAIQNYATTLSIESQVGQLLQRQRELQMAIDAQHSKTGVLEYFLAELNFNGPNFLTGRDPADMSEMGTALPGYTPDDLLRIMDVFHLRVNNDAIIVVRRGHSLAPEDNGRAAGAMMALQVRDLITSPGPSVVVIDGHFDRTQIGKVSPLSYSCAMLSQALRQQSAVEDAESPRSPKMNRSANVVLEYYCALHTQDDDNLRGPQGLIRCLTTQLILALVSNEWIGQVEPVNLPYLRDGEEELLAQQSLAAICRLFAALVHLVPKAVPIYCLVDGWSVYEREELWRSDYDAVVDGFRDAADASRPDGGTNFKLLLTSATQSRLLPDDFVLPGQRVSLRERAGGGRNWTGAAAARGRLMGLARSATLPNDHIPYGSDFVQDNGLNDFRRPSR